MELKMPDEVLLNLMPPEEGREHDNYYDITCSICYFCDKECGIYQNICEEGNKGYFKRVEQKAV